MGVGITCLPSHQGGGYKYDERRNWGPVGCSMHDPPVCGCALLLATPLPTMGQIANWTRLVSGGKAAGVGDGYSEIKTKLWRLTFQEASPPHWPADGGLTTHFEAIAMLLKQALTTMFVLRRCNSPVEHHI